MAKVKFKTTQTGGAISAGPRLWSPFRPITRWGRVVEDLRTGGNDPMYRRNMLRSFLIHFMIIVVIPWLLTLGNRVELYKLPKGSGVPDPAGMATGQQEIIKVKQKPKPKKARKKFVLRANATIYFHVPDMDDSQALKDVQEVTELTYKAEGNSAQEMVQLAQAAAAARGTGQPGETAGGLVKGGTGKSRGRLGKGGGTQGGWPEGSENSKIRFIRLNHGGRDWDDGMNPQDRSDLNFLDEFGKYTEFKVERTNFEGYRIGQIAGMDKGYKPPFLYMTGTSSIPMSPSEMKLARDYLLEGGMIFGDCGSPEFNSHFRTFANQLIPGATLVEIADDDPIFRVPFELPNGAPPLWHHGGYKAMGVKYQGRWVVFYHPGDLKDAFRTGGSGLDARLRQTAVQLGINVIYYAFNNYLEKTKQYRK